MQRRQQQLQQQNQNQQYQQPLELQQQQEQLQQHLQPQHAQWDGFEPPVTGAYAQPADTPQAPYSPPEGGYYIPNSGVTVGFAYFIL